jgi:hypothetical protein
VVHFCTALRKYCQTHPQAVEQNRRKQRDRSQSRRLAELANNNLAFDLKSSAAKVYWIGPNAANLANEDLDSGQVFVLEALVHQPSATFASCKQHPYGAGAVYDYYGAPPVVPAFAFYLVPENDPGDFGPNLQVVAVPEPRSTVLWAGALAVLALIFRRAGLPALDFPKFNRDQSPCNAKR